MASKAMESQGAAKPHLTTGKGGVAGEVDDLRKDVDAGFETLESRSGYPDIHWVDGGLVAVGGDHVIKGAGLLAGQTFASVTLGASLEIIMRVPGAAGNDESVEVVDSGGGGLAVSYAANKLSIDLGGAAPNEDTIATAVNSALVGAPVRANSGGGEAFGTVAETSLTGGAGDGWECKVTGEDAPIKFDTGAATSSANLTETEATVTVPDLTGLGDARAAGDVATLEVVSDGMSDKTSAILA